LFFSYILHAQTQAHHTERLQYTNSPLAAGVENPRL